MGSVKPDERSKFLKHSRELKMARSVHAFVRGSTAKFYEWLADSQVAKLLPDGPAIWICGDCHLGNLGPVADSDDRVEVQIRDLDQTVIGNPALDLVRLGLSLQTAARSSDLPGVTTAHLLEAMSQGYVSAFVHDAGSAPEPDVVRIVRKRAGARRWRDLARERIRDTEPNIPLGKRFWRLAKDEREAIDALFEQDEVRERALAIAGLGGKGRLRVVDAAYWVKGCSSLGTLRFAVLLGVKEKGEDEYFALVDIKEAVRPLAPVSADGNVPRDHAKRVVAGARALSPNLGDRMIAARLLGRSVVLRELKPQDLKLEVEQFSRGEAIRAAAYLAAVIGKAHARQLDPDRAGDWIERFGRRPDTELDAPSWLWRAVVDLAGVHEVAYLDHCRRYALG